MTSNPSAASATAIPRPIPRDPPVTIAQRLGPMPPPYHERSARAGRDHLWKRSRRVNAQFLRHHVERALLDLFVDAADVFAEDADRDELHAADEHHHRQQRGETGDGGGFEEDAADDGERPGAEAECRAAVG